MYNTDHSMMKLGKGPAVYDRNLKTLKSAMPVKLPYPPHKVDWTGGVTSWGMHLNGPNTYGNGVPPDGLGDCTIAAPIDAEEVWTLNAKGAMAKVPDSVALEEYEAWDGYIAGNPNTDQGGNMLSVMQDWQKYGFPNLPPILSFTPIHEITVSNQAVIDPLMFQVGVWLFGGVSTGIQMPVAWQTSAVWDTGSGPEYEVGSWGGHNPYCVGYNATGPVFITWGMLVQATWMALRTYADEAYVATTPSWITKTGLSPSGIALVYLNRDVVLV